MQKLQTEVLSGGTISHVDYDLAISELENRNLVGTGPKQGYDNPPNSDVPIIAWFSKREYIYFKKEGYRVAGDQTKR